MLIWLIIYTDDDNDYILKNRNKNDSGKPMTTWEK